MFKVHFKNYFSKLIALVLCVLGVINLYTPTILSGFSFMQTDKIDSLFIPYIQEHLFKVFFDTTYIGSFYSAPFFFPISKTVLYSDVMLGFAPFYWLLRVFFSWHVAAQLLMILAPLLTYFCFIALLRYLKVNTYIAALSAFVFCFGMLRMAHLSHPQLNFQMYMPLSLLFLLKFVKVPKFKYLNLFILFTFLQTTVSIYTGYFLIISYIFLMFIMPLYLRDSVFDLSLFVTKNKKNFLIALVFWFGVFLLYWGPYFSISAAGWTWRETVLPFLPTVGSWFLATSGSVWSKILSVDTSKIVNSHEMFLFPGLYFYFLLVVSIKFLFNRSKELNFEDILIKVFTVIFLLFVLITLRIGDFSLWKIVYSLMPGAGALRAISRVWLVADFYLLLAGSVLITKYVTSIKSKYMVACFTLVYCFFVFEQWVPFKQFFIKQSFLNDVANVSSLIASDCTVFYVEASTVFVSGAEDNILAMWSSHTKNIPTLNGYSGLLLTEAFGPFDINRFKSASLYKDFKGQICVISRSGDTWYTKDVYNVQ